MGAYKLTEPTFSDSIAHLAYVKQLVEQRRALRARVNRKVPLIEMVQDLRAVSSDRLFRKTDWTHLELIDSSGTLRDFLFSVLLPEEWVKFSPFRFKKDTWTWDEIFGRTCIIECIISDLLDGFVNEDIVTRIQPLLIQYRVLRSVNQELREWQQEMRPALVEHHADPNVVEYLHREYDTIVRKLHQGKV